MTATPSVDRAASRLVAALEHAWTAIGRHRPDVLEVVEAASGCRCRQARARPTCPAQRVRRNGCSPRLRGAG